MKFKCWLPKYAEEPNEPGTFFEGDFFIADHAAERYASECYAEEPFLMIEVCVRGKDGKLYRFDVMPETTVQFHALEISRFGKFKCWCPDDGEEPEEFDDGTFTSAEQAAEAFARSCYSFAAFRRMRVNVRAASGSLHGFRVTSDVKYRVFTDEK